MSTLDRKIRYPLQRERSQLIVLNQCRLVFPEIHCCCDAGDKGRICQVSQWVQTPTLTLSHFWILDFWNGVPPWNWILLTKWCVWRGESWSFDESIPQNGVMLLFPLRGEACKPHHLNHRHVNRTTHNVDGAAWRNFWNNSSMCNSTSATLLNFGRCEQHFHHLIQIAH